MAALDGKTALITGASRGIGEAIATLMAEQGATPVLVSRKLDGLTAAAERIEQATGVKCPVFTANTGDLNDIQALFAQLDSQGITVDVLVNNAATNPYFGPMMQAEWSAWDKTFDVNLKGTFALSREVAKRLVDAEKPGSIINISSVYGMMGAPWQGLYAMTKAAMISLSKTLAQEWGPAGIRVNALAPGLVDTKFAKAIVDNPKMAAVFTKRSALKRHGEPEEIAGLVCFLASDAASFITGAVLPIDGGYTAG